MLIVEIKIIIELKGQRLELNLIGMKSGGVEENSLEEKDKGQVTFGD